MSNRDDERRHASWDVASAPRNYLALAFAQTVSFGSSFVLMSILTRALGPSGYGEVVAIIAASLLAMQLSVSWTATAMNRFGSEEFVQTGRIAKSFWARSAMLVAASLVMLATGFLWLPALRRLFHLGNGLDHLLLGYLLSQACWVHVQQSLLAAKLPRHQAGLLTVERLLSIGGALALAYGNHLTANAVVSVYIGSSVVVSCVGLVFLRPMLGSMGSADLHTARRLFRYSVPLIPLALVSYLSTSYLDTLFLIKYLSLADAGRYAAVAQITGAFTQLPTLAGSLVLPALLSHASTAPTPATVEAFFRVLLPVLALAWTGACLALALAGPPMLSLLFGARFGDSTALLCVMLLVAAISGPILMGLLPAAHLLAMPHILTINGVATASFNVILNIVLIPRFGLIGCAWASALAAVASFLITFALIVRAVPNARWKQTSIAPVPLLLVAAVVSASGGMIIAAIASTAAVAVLGFFMRAELREGIRALRVMRAGGAA